MATQSFKDLIVWQKSRDLVTNVYLLCKTIKDFGYRDQLQRAAVSIMNNIAEGHARRSDNSFRHFLSIAKGSAAEVESMLLLGVSLGYVKPQIQTELALQTQEVSKLLSGLIKKL